MSDVAEAAAKAEETRAIRARVTVYPRREILDPQGKAIQGALAGIGYTEVEEVRAGKSFEITLGGEDRAAAESRLAEMCERLLANTVVEDYRVELLDDDRLEEVRA